MFSIGVEAGGLHREDDTVLEGSLGCIGIIVDLVFILVEGKVVLRLV